MTKTPVKFRKNWYKTVGAVAPTRYLLSIHFVLDNAGKMAKFNLQKSNKRLSEYYIQATCKFPDLDQNISEVSKESV